MDRNESWVQGYFFFLEPITSTAMQRSRLRAYAATNGGQGKLRYELRTASGIGSDNTF